MKNMKIVSLMLFIVSLFALSSQINAQYYIVGFSQTNMDQPARLVRAKSGTFVDYYIAYDYIPRVHKGEIYRTDNSEQTLAEVSGFGYTHQLVINGIPTSLIGVGYDYQTSNYVPGKTYCTYTTHWVGGYEYYYSGGTYFYDPFRVSQFSSTGGGSQVPWIFNNPSSYYAVFKWYRLGPTQDCKVAPYDPPSIASITPSGAQEGSVVPVAITGTNFVNPQLSVSGGGVTATITSYSSNFIAAVFNIMPGADLTNRDVKVTASGGNSNTVNFKIGDHTPQIQSISPTEGIRGRTTTVTVNGTYFGADPELVIEGQTGITPTITAKTSTQIQANFAIDSNAAEGNRTIKVRSKGRSGNGFITTPGASDLSNGINFNVKKPPIPTITIKEVGFGGDYPLIRYATEQPITDPTWIVNDSSNPQNYVAYKKDVTPSAMKISAKITLDQAPPPGEPLQARVRVKSGSTVVAEQSTSQSVSTDQIVITDLPFSGALESVKLVKKGTYDFNWEVSFDDGQNWTSAGTSQHVIYWTYGDVTEPANCATDGTPRTCLFVNDFGDAEFPGLYDFALEKAIDFLPASSQSPDLIAKFLARKIDEDLAYNPGTVIVDALHPLASYGEPQGVQCAVNANLLRGLLRSIGVNNSEAVYVWGGKPFTNDKTESSGLTYGFLTAGDPGFYYSMQAIRPPNADIVPALPEDPFFTFHAMVKIYDGTGTGINNLNARYYDPSYASRLEANPAKYSDYPYVNKDLRFRRAANLDDPIATNHRWVANDETKPYVVRDFNLRSCLNPRSYCEGTGYTKYFDGVFANVIAPTGRPSAFDSQGVSTFTVWRPANGIWYTLNGYTQTNVYASFGMSGDKIAPADYDGDGITDYAVLRPGNTTFYIMESATQTFRAVTASGATDLPVSGDYDGDGKSDIAFYRPGWGSNWFITLSSTGASYLPQFGAPEDKPVSNGDFDGDGKTDVAVWRPSTGEWHWWKTTDGTWASKTHGQSGDIPAPGDYNRDGFTDFAVFRPSTGKWYIWHNRSRAAKTITLGSAGDIPVPGDYDGDGLTDVAVWNPSTGVWSVRSSRDNTIKYESWGSQSVHGDVPANGAFIY